MEMDKCDGVVEYFNEMADGGYCSEEIIDSMADLYDADYLNEDEVNHIIDCGVPTYIAEEVFYDF